VRGRVGSISDGAGSGAQSGGVEAVGAIVLLDESPQLQRIQEPMSDPRWLHVQDSTQNWSTR
jgi:hypothetical protein